MRLLDLFRKRKKAKTKRKRRSRQTQVRTKHSIPNIRADIKNVQAQLKTMHIALEKHDNELSQHSQLIRANSEGLKRLEQMIEETIIKAPTGVTSPPTRPVVETMPPALSEHTTQSPPRKFDINHLSEQEKRILAVFFHNKDMALSYVDIAKALNKSHHTVKNQMNQMRLKADLFNCAVGDESRKRFKLKDGLKIEKYLNVG